MIVYIPKLGSDIGKINFFIRKLGLFDKILDKKVLKIAKNMKFKIYSTKEDKIRQKSYFEFWINAIIICSVRNRKQSLQKNKNKIKNRS